MDNDPASAVLLIAVERGVERVACVCEAASAAGVRVGMTVAHARSLLASRKVRIAPHRPEEVERALDRLVQWAFRFSPVVKADYPDGLLLDITGCEHLHAGEEKLARKIVGALEQWRFPARVCVAPTATAARAVAQHTQQRITVIPDHAAGDELRFLPVSALGVEPDICDALAEIGVVDIDQLLNLPREDLANLFGTALLAKIDQAMGLVHELFEPDRQIEPVEFTRIFDGAIRNQEAIFLAVEQLLREMTAHLARNESGVSRMSIKFFRIDDIACSLRPVGPVDNSPAFQRWDSDAQKSQVPEGRLNSSIVPTGLNHPAPDDPAINRWAISSAPLRDANQRQRQDLPDISLSLSFPSRDLAHLWSLLRPKLERVQLGYGVEAIVLRVHHAQRLPHTQMELWPDATSATHIDDHAVMGRWLDQVIERLGRHAVVQIQPAQRYLPEETFTPQIVNQAQSSTLKVQKHAKKTKESALPCYPAIRPSRLFNPPEHARVIALVPDSPPAWIHWQGQDTNVVCGYGPERISAPWWNESKSHEGEGDQGGSPNKTQRHEGETRDYFVIHTEPGLWLWVYRDCSTGEWFVHGEWI